MSRRSDEQREELKGRIAARRTDNAFRQRLARILARDRTLLERLAK
jgi:hypothetical protein